MTIEQKLDFLIEKVVSIDERLGAIEKRMDSMERRMDAIEQEIVSVKADVRQLKTDVRDLKADTNIIKLRIDNELKVNIQRVAEGHLDLHRKLEKALKPSAELEMLSIKVRVLESEVDEIKRKIS